MDSIPLDESDEQLVWESAFVLDHHCQTKLISDEVRPFVDCVSAMVKPIPTPILVASIAIIVLALGGTEIYLLLSDSECLSPSLKKIGNNSGTY